MPIRSAAPKLVICPGLKQQRSHAGHKTRLWLAAVVGGVALMVPAAQASAAELLTNGGFESGTFSGWTTTQLTQPLTPWTLATTADRGFFVAASPQEGTYDAMNGFDGDGPGSFTLSQTVSIPSGATVLSWKDRIQYAMNQDAAARLLEVKILDPSTDAVLATVYTFTTGPGDGTCCSIPPGHDTGWQAHSVDLSAFGGQTVKLVFDETIPGNYTGPGQIEFDAISVMSLLSVSPGELTFAPHDVGDGPTATQESTLTNTTGQTVTLSGLTVGGDDPAQFGLRSGQPGDCTSSTVLADGEACDVGVNFDPTTIGEKTATLTFASNEPDVTLALTGTATQRELSRDPIALALGSRDVEEGPTAAEASTVTNSGTGPVTLSGLTLSGDAAQFERLSGQAGDCTAATVLAAGETCAVRVSFDPTSQGAKAATLTVASDAYDLTVALTGTGTQTELTGSPATLDMGSREVDAGPTAGQGSVITNSGTEPVTLSGLTLSGDAAQFELLRSQSSDCATATVLSAGQTCDVRLNFDPTTTGAKSATLTVASNAADISVALSGSGTQVDTGPDGSVETGDDGIAIANNAHAAKLSVARATINRRDRVLDVLAPITSRASGRVNVELHAAGQRYRFTAPIDPVNARLRFRQRIPAAQAQLGTGIITIAYSGDSDTRPQTVRLRSASRPAALGLERPQVVNGRVQASGTVDPLARGVVRLQLEYNRGDGHRAFMFFRAPINNGRWTLDEQLPETTAAEIAQRRGTVHSYTLFTGYMPERVRGEMRSFQVLGDR